MAEQSTVRILNVDDNEAKRYSVTRLLRKAGFDVLEAVNGEEALRQARLNPDLIILDVNLPDLSGFEIARRLKADPATSAIHILHLSATAIEISDRVQGLESGADAYLAEPVEAGELLATVKALLRIRRAEELSARLLAREQAARAEAELQTRRLQEANEELTAQREQLERLNQELERLYEASRKADQRKDEFLAMLGHELRNPLGVISNSLHLLEPATSLDDRAQHHRAMAGRQVAQLSRLVEDLLDISRISRGKIDLRLDTVDLGQAVEEAVHSALGAASERRHELALSLPPETVWVRADPARLSQILANLLNNAVKFTEPGGRIDLAVEVDGNRLMVDGQSEPSTINHQPSTAVIRVRDTGVGIAPETLPHIFDLFAQADRSLDRSEGGLGIGLTLVYNLVQLHGGTVEARSEGPGKGSEFVVRLPVLKSEVGRQKDEGSPRSAVGSQPSAGESETPPPNAEPRTPNPDLPPSSFCLPTSKTVLVVDDNPDSADTLAELLRMWGHEVEIAYDGAAAVRSALAAKPDVVLCDIGLPGMDGYQVAAELRRILESGAGHLVAITGYGQEKDVRRALEAGFDAHLTKPVSPEALRSLLSEGL